MHLSRVLLWGIVADVGLTAVAVMLDRLTPLPVPADKFLFCGILVLLYLGVAVGCAVARENGRAPRLMLSGILVGALALLGWIIAVWVEPAAYGDEVLAALAWPTSWACLMMLVGLLLLPRPRPGWWAALRRASFILLAILAAHICLALTFYPGVGRAGGWQVDSELYQRANRYEEVANRIGGALALLAGGSSLAVFLGVWVPGLARAPLAPSARLSYRLRCPRCQTEQQATTGAHSCTRCGLRIRVEVA